MSYKINDAKILTEDDYIFGDLIVEEGKILEIIENKNLKESNKIVFPGFFDIHTHGGDGKDFSTCENEEDVIQILNFYTKHGVTSVFPTLLTEKDDLIYRQLELIYKVSKDYPIIKGVHLEGPFLSKKFKGAQLEECLQKPSIEKCKIFMEKSHNLFKYMTIAPENEGSEETIRFLVKNGIRVSLGHSDATFDEATVAVKAGATSITHCMNAMRGIHQHDPSILAAALYYDELYNEVILDGIHVNFEMVEFLRKIKGTDKIIGITDSLMAAGLEDGEYKIGNTPIVVLNHDCKIKETGVRAGSTLDMKRAFDNLRNNLGLSDLDCAKMLSLNASKMLGMNNIGSLKVGKNADFIVMNSNYEIKEVYISGRRMF